MNKQIEIINTRFEKVLPKNEKGTFFGGLWAFLCLVAVLIFCFLYLLIFSPLGWLGVVILTLLYKFIVL